MRNLEVVRNINWWVVMLTALLAMIGVSFIHSATIDDVDFSNQPGKQTLFFLISAVLGIGVMLVPYPRIMRSAWVLYGGVVLALLLLPWFGSLINNARRWYLVFGYGVQPSEFAKLVVIIVLASWLRFRNKATTREGLLVPLLITAAPVALIFGQPDLGSSLVFWPILLAMCYVAGTPARTLLGVCVIGIAGLLLLYATMLHDYQRLRIEVWLEHFSWDRESVEWDRDVVTLLRGPAYQPWQSLIAIGGGGLVGAGFQLGPQSRFDFLPYRSGDYLFSVIAEEIGWLGAVGVLGLQLLLVVLLLGIASRTRERFGRLVAVGVATWLGTQSVLHVMVCAWFVPATGLPMPLLSYGGSSTLVAVLAIALVVNIGARREPVLASDGFG